jgi:hypothetical protein
MAGYLQLRRVQRNSYRLASHYSIGMADRGRVRSQRARQKGFNGLSVKNAPQYRRGCPHLSDVRILVK